MSVETIPALLGGPAVCPAGPPDWPVADPAVLAALQSAHADGSWGRYHGPHVASLETALARWLGVPSVSTCASGTLAIEIALRALGVTAGDEVILGAYEYEPNFLTVHVLGAVPVLIDASPSKPCLDPERLEAAITPNTKAVIATHLHGGLVAMSRVMEITGRHGIGVVEDAAQVCGAVVEGKPAGAWGDLGVWSFGGSKLLTAGRGGAIVVRRPDLAQRVRLALSRGLQQWAALSELQAAVLVPQLDGLAERTDHRLRQVERIAAGLADVPGLTPFPNDLPDRLPAYFKVGYYYDEAAFGLPRHVFVKALRAEGIAFDIGFRALHVGRSPGRYKAVGPLANAEVAGQSVVMLHHPVLAHDAAAADAVAVAIGKTYRNAGLLR